MLTLNSFCVLSVLSIELGSHKFLRSSFVPPFSPLGLSSVHAGGTVPLGRLSGESGVGWRVGCVFPVVGCVASSSAHPLVCVFAWRCTCRAWARHHPPCAPRVRSAGVGRYFPSACARASVMPCRRGSVSSSAMLWVEVLVGGLRPPRVVCTGLVVVLPSQVGGCYHFFPRFLPFERSE